jgi:competence protein ComEC
MSYAAVIAIVWIYPIVQKLWYPKSKPLRYVWQLLSVSVAAQVGVLPISLFYFHQFPGLFFVSNLLIVPTLGIILGTGIIVIFLSLINQLPVHLARIFNEMISYMNTIVAWVARQEDFIFKDISFDGIQLLLAYFLIVTLILLLGQVNYKRLMFVLSSLLFIQGYTVFKAYASSQKSEVLVLHQTKNTIIMERIGSEANVYTSNSNAAKNPVTDIKVGERIATVRHDTIVNSYLVRGKSFLVLDSLGIYPLEKKVETVLLTQSPKINLDRFISTTNPRQIIADGSNYTSNIERWKATCLKRKIPFHYTGEKGYYVFNGKD